MATTADRGFRLPASSVDDWLAVWLVGASASEGAAAPRGHGPPFGTTSCLYEGPWHIHVPLGPWPRGTASSACLKVAASVADSGRRRASGAGPQSVTSVHMATEKRGVMRATPPVALRVRAVQGRAKPCARRAEGGRPVAMGVERHRDVPRSRAEAGTPARATTPMAAGRRPRQEPTLLDTPEENRFNLRCSRETLCTSDPAWHCCGPP